MKSVIRKRNPRMFLEQVLQESYPKSGRKMPLSEEDRVPASRIRLSGGRQILTDSFRIQFVNGSRSQPIEAQALLRTKSSDIPEAELLVNFGVYWDLVWLFDDAQKRTFLNLSVADFGGARTADGVGANLRPDGAHRGNAQVQPGSGA